MRKFFVLFLAVMTLSAYAKGKDKALQTGRNGEVVVQNGEESLGFDMDFILIYRDDNPKMELKNLTECRYFVPVWQVPDAPAEKVFRQKEYGAEHGGDGIDANLQKKSGGILTGDYFCSGRNIPFREVSRRRDGDTLAVFLNAEGYGSLDVRAYLDGKAYPVLSYRFTAERKGYFSILYKGAPDCSLDDAFEVWQPMVWQQKRFPENSYLTMAYQCSLPATLVSIGKISYGVMADSSEFPFMPLPSREGNNRFGVLLRNASGGAQPMLAAPILGGENSLMNAGDTFPMKMRLVLSGSPIPQLYSEIAKDYFGFKDYRRNRIASTNQIIDRIADYTLSPYSNFVDSLKGCSYSTDVPGSTKNVSSLHPLSIALVTDNDSLFSRRALPIMEYMLSRDNFLFCLDTTQKVQNPSRKLGRPCATTSELITLYDLTGRNNGFLKKWAEDKFYNRKPESERQKGRGLWNDALAMYKASGESEYLDWAVRGADSYIGKNVDQMQTTLKSEFFWSAFVPKYIHLLDLYETTGDRKYLDAAHKAARYYAMFVWMCPAIPDGQITVNKGNKAPWYWYLKSRGIPQQYAPEETVEAWRLSEIGLTAESPTTGIGHRAVFMAHHAPYFLRIAHYTGDTFLRDIARSAVVGRYRNFPGYHINTMRNTAYEQLDFPYHKHNEISATSFHYNHPFPHLSILIDYLVTDAFDKSGERINFPSRHIEGYGYLQNRFYGSAPGVFYSEKNVWLWMPAGLVVPDNVELNYLSGRTEDALCIAFMNQSDEKAASTIKIDTGLVPSLKDREVEAELWSSGGREGTVVIKDGILDLEVPQKGIMSVIVKNCHVTSVLQDKFKSKGKKWKHDYYESELGNMSAMLLDFGKEMKTVYVFLRDDDSVFRKVDLKYRYGNGDWKVIEDEHYPFEFSFPLEDGEKRIVMSLSLTDLRGNVIEIGPFVLSEK